MLIRESVTHSLIFFTFTVSSLCTLVILKFISFYHYCAILSLTRTRFVQFYPPRSLTHSLIYSFTFTIIAGGAFVILRFIMLSFFSFSFASAIYFILSHPLTHFLTHPVFHFLYSFLSTALLTLKIITWVFFFSSCFPCFSLVFHSYKSIFHPSRKHCLPRTTASSRCSHHVSFFTKAL